MSKETFENGFIELVGGAIDEKGKERCRNANILYWKALMQLCDYIYWKEKGDNPKNLNQRLSYFKDGDIKKKKVMTILGDKLMAGTPYNIYEDTYKNKQDKKDCEVMENAIRNLVKQFGLKGVIKNTIKKI